MQNSADFSNYISPFSWRYGSIEMRRIWSEQHKYELWRKIWVNLAKAQNGAGLVSGRELKDLIINQKNLDILRILEIEKETKHDVVAAIKEFAEKAKIGGGKIHLGATSMDIVDNTDVLRMKDGLEIIRKKLKIILAEFSIKIKENARLVCIGYTHLQPAEPTTVGYRLAFYAQDLLTDYNFLRFIKTQLKGKGFKGAVGTAAGYHELLSNTKVTSDVMEQEIMRSLGTESVLISSQVYPRKFDYLVLTALNSIASSLAKFAADLRFLQSPSLGEWSEPFEEKQVGSSAMPFKKNPVSAENICSLARFVAALPQVALENATLSYLERTLDDSANKRLIIPEAFLATDQILMTAEKIIKKLIINEKRITYNLHLYAPFACTEAILMKTVKNGADRQEMHEILRTVSLVSWQKIQEGQVNPMKELLTENKQIRKYLKKEKMIKLLEVKNHIGDAPERALKLAGKIDKLY